MINASAASVYRGVSLYVPPPRRTTPSRYNSSRPRRLLLMRRRTLLPILAFAPFLFAAATGSPMLRVLPRFTAFGVPPLGPQEHPVQRTWPDPATTPSLPGHGLNEHPMLYAGEGYNKLLLVNHGEVVWSYSTGPGGEIDDVWMLSNGNILFTRQFQVQEVNPKKEIVWHYDAPPGTRSSQRSAHRPRQSPPRPERPPAQAHHPRQEVRQDRPRTRSPRGKPH